MDFHPRYGAPMNPGTGAIRRGAPDIGRGLRVEPALLARIWREFARPYRGLLAGFLGVILIASAVTVVPPLLFKLLIDEGVLAGNLRMVNLLALAAVGVAVAAALVSLVQRWISARVGEGLIFDLRRTLYDHVQRMPIAFFTRTQTGALISRLNNDVIGAQQAVTTTFGSVAQNLVQVVVVVGVMLRLEWRLTLLVLVVLPAFVVPARLVGSRLQALTRRSMQLNAEMNSRMTERFNVSGALLVKLYGRYAAESREFADRAGKVADIGVRTALLGRTFFVTLALVGAVGTAVVYWVGGRLAITSEAFTAGDIVAFAALVTQAYNPLSALTNARVEIMRALVSFERVFEVLDVDHPIRDADDAVPLGKTGGRAPPDTPGPRGEIVFDRVTFRYPTPSESSLASLEEPTTSADPPDTPDTPDTLGQTGGPAPPDTPGQPVLRDVSFAVAPGQTVALVGPSGAGKTTICNLVTRLYDVTGGAVRIDGQDIRAVTLDSLSAAIGVVSQDPHLFHDTVRSNLRYARPEASDGELQAACTAAQIHDLVSGLPEGYDTVVGERGYRMSGGEKQRLAIARLLLKDPAIVVLDEATAHLDSESEAAVQRALSTALAGRSSLVIAHRLSTIVNADLILVVQGGRVVQQGTHAELVDAEGLYADLYRTQFAARTA